MSFFIESLKSYKPLNNMRNSLRNEYKRDDIYNEEEYREEEGEEESIFNGTISVLLKKINHIFNQTDSIHDKMIYNEMIFDLYQYTKNTIDQHDDNNHNIKKRKREEEPYLVISEDYCNKLYNKCNIDQSNNNNDEEEEYDSVYDDDSSFISTL